jgi:hypothetical protein
VRVHAEVVSQAVGEESCASASLENLLGVTLQDTHLEQTVDGDLVGCEVDVVPVLAGLDLGHGVELHLVDNVVDLARLFGEFAIEGEGSCLDDISQCSQLPTISTNGKLTDSYNIRGIVAPLRTSVNEQIGLALKGCIVVHVVQSSSSGAGGENRVVGHLLCAVSDTPLEERGLELLLIGRRLGPLHNGLVRQAGDVVCLPDQGHLVLVLGNTGGLDTLLEDLEILVLEVGEGDVVGDLVLDGEDGRRGVRGSEARECRVHVRGVLDLVDVVLGEGVIDADGQARPDDIVRVDRGDEQCRLGGLDVVGQVAVGEVAA